LNRAEERMVPSWPLELTMTPTPLATALPEIPAMNVAVVVGDFPMRVTPVSPATPTLPISMLLLPVVRV